MSTQKEKPYLETGRLIRNFRHSKEWTAEQFAAKLGVSYPTVSRIENGHHGPSASLLKKLGSLGMDIMEITPFSRPHSKEQTLSYRLSEVENRLAEMEATIRKLMDLQDSKGG